MKKLTRKNLQAARGAEVDDIVRFEAPKGRAKFIVRVLYDNFFQAPKVNIVYLLFLILAASFDIAQGEIDKFPHAVFIVLLIKSRLVYYAYKQYESIQKARIFMAFDSEGIMQVAPLIDKGGYVVLDGAAWKNIQAIRFYSDFMSIEVVDGSKEGIVFFVMTDNPRQYETALATMWYEALNPSND